MLTCAQIIPCCPAPRPCGTGAPQDLPLLPQDAAIGEAMVTLKGEKNKPLGWPHDDPGRNEKNTNFGIPLPLQGFYLQI